MEDRKLQIIKELMEQLQDEMSYGAEDFEERLGRKKPDVKVLKIEGEMDPMESMDDEPESEMGADEDMELESEGPDSELKKRLMKLRA